MPERTHDTDRSIDRDRLLLKMYEEEAALVREEMNRVDRAIGNLDKTRATLQMSRASLQTEASGLARLMSRTRERITKSEQDGDPQQRDRDGEMQRIDGVSVIDNSESRPIPQIAHNLREWSRMDAVAHVLEFADGPLSPTEIVERLSIAGRDDDARVVSAALNYLREKRRAHRVGRGQWVAGPGPAASSDDPLGGP
jgi:hypothetical protein